MNNKFVVGRSAAAKVAGVPLWRISETIPSTQKIVGRQIYSTKALKSLFPETYNELHSHLTYAKLSEYLKEHLLALFRSSRFAMRRGFTRVHLVDKVSFTNDQINTLLESYPECFYLQNNNIHMRSDAPLPAVKIQLKGRKRPAACQQPALQPALPLTYTPKDLEPADLWASFLDEVRKRKPLISSWFDVVEFKRTSLVTAQLIVDERNTVAVEFFQQKNLVEWIESRMADLNAHLSIEVVVKRARPETGAAAPERAVPALPPVRLRSAPAPKKKPSLWQRFRAFIAKSILP